MASSEPLVAYHGDRWVSPRWAVTAGGAPTDPSQWWIVAQARRTTEEQGEPTFSWSVAAGTVLLGTAQVTLSSGATITTGTVQLLIRPADWVGKPRAWDGVVDVELSSDDSAAPADRITVVKTRRLKIVPDVAYA